MAVFRFKDSAVISNKSQEVFGNECKLRRIEQTSILSGFISSLILYLSSLALTRG